MERRQRWTVQLGPNEIFALSAALSLNGKHVDVVCEGRSVGSGIINSARLEDGGALTIEAEIVIDHPAMFGLSGDSLSYVIRPTP